MKIYLAIKYHHDLKNKELIESLCSHFSNLGHTIICIHKDIELWGEIELSPEDLMKHAFKIIDKSDLVLVEFSEKGVGLGIEAGYAHARNKKIVTIAKEGSDISTTLKGVSSEIFFYQNVDEVIL